MVGIIILNYNRYDLTIACIKSIKESIRYKIYVVDNGSNKENVRHLQEGLKQFSESELILSEENLGFSKGMNLGAVKAMRDGCEYLLFTNSDILFSSSNIESLRNSLNKSSQIGMVGPRITDIHGKEQHFNVLKRESLFAYILMETAFSVFLPGFYKSKFLMRADQNYDKKEYVYSLSGCIFMMKKDDFEAIQYLDEYTFLYSEEFILAEKIMSIHKKELYDGTITITHNHQGSTTQGSAFVEKHKIRSRLYYLKEYRKASYLYRKFIYMLMLINAAVLHKVNQPFKMFYRETKEYVR